MVQQQKNRFVAHQTGKHVALKGSITDTTTFEAINKLIENGTTINCAELGPCSWNGLCAFVDHIKDQKLNDVVLTNVAPGLYRYLKLIPSLTEAMQVISFSFYGKKIVDGKLHPALMSWKETDTVPMDSDFIPPKSPGELGDIARFLVTSLFPMPISTPAPESPHKLNDEQSDLFFWYRYSQFVHDTVGLTVLLIESVLIGLGDIFTRLDARLQTAQAGFAKLSTPVTIPGYDLSKLSDNVAKTMAPSIANMHELHAQFDHVKFDLLQKLTTTTNTDDLTEKVETLIDATFLLVESAAQLEQIGANIGEQIQALRAEDDLKSAVTALTSSPLSADDLKELRDAFLIVDVMSDGDQELSKDEILSEIAQIGSEINRCIVQVQGFDLARQMLEHRVKEAKLIKEWAMGDGPKVHSLNLKSEVIKLIIDRMVTDQEKAVFKFYFPDEQQTTAPSDTLGAGDLLLF